MRPVVVIAMLWLTTAAGAALADDSGSGEAAAAMDAQGQLRNPVLESRYERITHELRCLVCQNESVADSNAPLAQDLRRQVREMLVGGNSDDAVFDFMTARYGEFVRYNPPLEAKTLLIWGAPFIMLLIGVAVIVRVVRQRSRLPLDDEPPDPGSRSAVGR
jgi:cytochrome c-type biogenesis protein CcmH